MASDPNTIRKFDDGADEITNEDLRDLASGKKNAYDIFDQNADFTRSAINIREQIQQAGNLLGEKEQQEFLKRLEWFERKRDAKELASLKKEISETIEDTTRLTREYFSRLDENKELFGLDESRKINTLKEYKDEFVSFDAEKKQKYLEELPNEIKSLQNLRDKLIKLVGNSRIHVEEFSKLRRHEKRDDYLPRLEENMRNFNDLMRKLEKSGKYNPRQLDIMAVRFKESSMDDQKKLFEEWGVEKGGENSKTVETFTKLKSDFDQFSDKRKTDYSREFENAKTRKEKTEIITSMRNELKNEYIEKVEHSKYFSPAEKNFALASVSRPDFDVKFIEECLKSFDKCEQQVKELAKIYKKAPREIREQYNFWDSDYNKKKEIAAEVRKHIDVMKKLEQRIKRLGEEGIIAKKTISEDKEYILEWRRKTRKLSLREKEKLLDDSSLNISFRKQVLEQFKTMPEEYKKRFEKRFMKGNLKERLKVILEIKKETEETKNLREKFFSKIEKMKQQKLIAPKTASSYKEWMQKLPLKELRKYYENSELDNPLRRKALETFESLDKKTQKENAHFYELDLQERMRLMRKLNPNAAKQIVEEAGSEREAKEKVIDFEKAAQIKALKKAADKFAEEGKTSAEVEILKQILEINPSNEESRIKLHELEMEQNPITQLLIYESIKNNPILMRKLEGLRIVEIFERIIEESERCEGARRIRERSKGFKDERMENLNESLFDYTKGEKILNKKGEAVDTEELDIDKIGEAEDQNIIEHYAHFFRDNRPDAKSEQTGLGEHEYRRFTVKKRSGEELNKNRIREEKKKIMKNLGLEMARARPNKQRGLKKISEKDLETATRKYSRLGHINID